MEPDPALFQENERLAPSTDERQYFDAGELTCESGAVLEQVTVAYETWGKLSSQADNAIVVCHALSGDSHAIGWWDRIIGPAKAIDTDQFFVIGTNALGGCQGTTGPASVGPDGRRYASRFPQVTVADMVEVQMRLVRSLGINRLHGVAGGSMGGMMALEWTLREPGLVEKAWITASCRAHSAMQIGYNETARQAIMRDPKWLGGEYPEDDPPVGGLAVEVRYAVTVNELNANSLFDWLNDHGPRFGWRRIFDLDAMQSHANNGGVAVICAKRKELNRSGHIAAVVPETASQQAARSGGAVVRPLQSQAGAANHRYTNGPRAWWQGAEFREFGFFVAP